MDSVNPFLEFQFFAHLFRSKIIGFTSHRRFQRSIALMTNVFRGSKRTLGRSLYVNISLNPKRTWGFGLSGGKNLAMAAVSWSFGALCNGATFGTWNLVFLRMISISFGALIQTLLSWCNKSQVKYLTRDIWNCRFPVQLLCWLNDAFSLLPLRVYWCSLVVVVRFAFVRDILDTPAIVI